MKLLDIFKRKREQEKLDPYKPNEKNTTSYQRDIYQRILPIINAGEFDITINQVSGEFLIGRSFFPEFDVAGVITSNGEIEIRYSEPAVKNGEFTEDTSAALDLSELLDRNQIPYRENKSREEIKQRLNESSQRRLESLLSRLE